MPGVEEVNEISELVLDFIYDARVGDLEEVKKFIAEGGNHNAADDLGNTALHMAAANGHSDVIKYLLTLSEIEDINMKNQSGNTPLHWAALNGSLEVVETLVEAGGDIAAVNNAEKCPVYEALNNKHNDVADFLLAKETGIGAGTSLD